jgi:uncharacterized protein involved in type VI secretion and phage assembly
MKRIPGVVVGIVKDLEDPKGQGRIQVDFPWLPKEQRSGWAPLATPLAGKDRGMFFMPEPEDEVLVAFHHGDFNHPFIVGFLWNGEDKPPETKSKKRLLVTPGGHRLLFDDDDPKKIELTAASGHKVVIDETTIALLMKAGTTKLTLTETSIKLQGGGRSLSLDAGKVQIL